MFRQGAGRDIEYESTKAELTLDVQKAIQKQNWPTLDIQRTKSRQ